MRSRVHSGKTLPCRKSFKSTADIAKEILRATKKYEFSWQSKTYRFLNYMKKYSFYKAKDNSTSEN